MVRWLCTLAGVVFVLAAAGPAAAQDTGTYFGGPLEWGQATGIAWVDFNGDGKTDYCRVEADARLACTVSTGRGFGATYRSAAAVDAGYPDGRLWGDVDGDKRADYCRRVGGGAAGPFVSCSRSTGTGFVTDPARPADWGFLPGTALADFTGDGKADYCRLLDAPPRVACSPGPGMASTISSPTIDGGDEAGRAWVDFNADGRADFCRVIGATAACSPSTGSGFASTVASFPFDAGYAAGRAWADVNGDRRADYCRRVGDAGTSRVQCTFATGIGFGTTVTSGVLEWGHDAGWAWVDFDGDGDRDFCRPVGQAVTTNQLFCTLVSTAGFGATIASGPLDVGYATDRAWVDHNGDGKADYCRRVGASPDQRFISCTISNGTAFGPLPSTTTPPLEPLAPSLTPTQRPGPETPRIMVTLAFDYSASRRSTLLRSLTVKGVPRGSTVTAKCAKGCKRKSYTKRNARGTVSLKPLLGKRLKVGRTIVVTVARPGSIGAVKTLRIRARRAPQVTTRCISPGGNRPTACG